MGLGGERLWTGIGEKVWAGWVWTRPGTGGREVDGDVPGEDEYRLRTQLAGNIREKGRFRVDEEWPGEARAG